MYVLGAYVLLWLRRRIMKRRNIAPEMMSTGASVETSPEAEEEVSLGSSSAYNQPRLHISPVNSRPSTPREKEYPQAHH